MTAAIEDIQREVIAIITKKLVGSQHVVKPEDRLDELGLDSFAAVEMIFDLEEKFDIEIPYNSNDARMDFETVRDVAEAIQNRLGSK